MAWGILILWWPDLVGIGAVGGKRLSIRDVGQPCRDDTAGLISRSADDHEHVAQQLPNHLKAALAVAAAGVLLLQHVAGEDATDVA